MDSSGRTSFRLLSDEFMIVAPHHALAIRDQIGAALGVLFG